MLLEQVDVTIIIPLTSPLSIQHRCFQINPNPISWVTPHLVITLAFLCIIAQSGGGVQVGQGALWSGKI